MEEKQREGFSMRIEEKTGGERDEVENYKRRERSDRTRIATNLTRERR